MMVYAAKRIPSKSASFADTTFARITSVAYRVVNIRYLAPSKPVTPTEADWKVALYAFRALPDSSGATRYHSDITLPASVDVARIELASGTHLLLHLRG